MKTDYTGMIPPVGVREKRPCFDCGWNEDHTEFNVFECGFLHLDTREDYYCPLRQDIDVTNGDRPTDDLCKYNYTSEELKELLDNLEK